MKPQAKMRKRELIVVADDRERCLPDSISDIPVRIVDWRDADQLSGLGDAALLVDIDLRDLSKVKAVKDSLPRRAVNQCRIVAIDRGHHLSEAQANGLGASALLKRPLDVDSLKALLRRHFPYEEPVRTLYSVDEQQALEREPGGTSIVRAAVELNRMFAALTRGRPLEIAKITQAADEIIDAVSDVGLMKWLDTVRQYHESTYQHCLIVTGVSTAFGHCNGMRRSDVLTLTIAALLHDIGKAQIPLEILDKPASLTAEEFSVMQRHPAIGYDYLCTKTTVSADIIDAVRHHHEYLEGSGYPDALPAQRIQDLTRILTVCDAYGALVEQRPYRAPKSPAAALTIVTDMAEAGKVEGDLVRALKYSVGD